MAYSPEEQQAYLAYLDAKAKMEGMNPMKWYKYDQANVSNPNGSPLAATAGFKNLQATARNNRETEKWYQDFKNAVQLKALQEAGGNNANGSVNTSMGNGTVTMSGGTVPTGDSMIANNSLGNLFKDGMPTVSMSGDSTVSPAAIGMAAGAALSGLGNFLGLRNGSGNYFPMNNSDTINTGVSDPQGLGQTKGLSYNQKVDALTQAAAQQRLNDTGTSFDNVLNGDNATSQQQAAYNTLINNNATTNSANPTIPVTANQQPAVSTGNGTTNQQTETATTSTQPAATVTPAAATDTQSQSKISQVLGNTSNTQGNINDPLSSYWSKANFDGRLIDQGVKNPFLRDIMYDRMVVPMQLQAHQDRLNNAMKVYLDKNATDEQKENAKAIIAIETQKPTMWEDRDLMLKEMELKDQYTRSRTNANNGKSYSGTTLADAFTKRVGQDGTYNGAADCIGKIGDTIRENGYEWTDSRYIPDVVKYAQGRKLWDEGATNYNIGDIVIGDAGTGEKDGHAAMYIGNGKFTYVAGSEGNTIATKTNPFNSVYGVIRTSELGGSRGNGNGRYRTPGNTDGKNGSKNAVLGSKFDPKDFGNSVGFLNEDIDKAIAAAQKESPGTTELDVKALNQLYDKHLFKAINPLISGIDSLPEHYDNISAGMAIYDFINQSLQENKIKTGFDPSQLARAVATCMAHHQGMANNQEEINKLTDAILYNINARENGKTNTTGTTNGGNRDIDVNKVQTQNIVQKQREENINPSTVTPITATSDNDNPQNPYHSDDLGNDVPEDYKTESPVATNLANANSFSQAGRTIFPGWEKVFGK